MTELFKSSIFHFQFDYDEWPSTHTDCQKYMRPFNGSIFDLRKQYRSVFHEEQFEITEESDFIESSKLYKISYVMNMLPVLEVHAEVDPKTQAVELVNEEISLMNLCFDSDEISVFETESIQALIEYKWIKFSQVIHLRGFLAHVFYVSILILYVYEVYIKNDIENQQIYSSLLIVGVIYPAWYEAYQLYKQGAK